MQNAAYFGAISANFPSISTVGPLFLQILHPALPSRKSSKTIFFIVSSPINIKLFSHNSHLCILVSDLSQSIKQFSWSTLVPYLPSFKNSLFQFSPFGMLVVHLLSWQNFKAERCSLCSGQMDHHFHNIYVMLKQWKAILMIRPIKVCSGGGCPLKSQNWSKCLYIYCFW